MFKKILPKILASFIVFVIVLPTLVFSQDLVTNSQIVDSCLLEKAGIFVIFCKFLYILNYTIPIILSLGILYFVWGVVKFVISDAEEAKKKGKDQILYGLIGITVVLSLWGLVELLRKSFGFIGEDVSPTLTPLPVSSTTCTLQGSPKLSDLFCYVTKMINDSVIPLIFTLATVLFIWGGVKFFIMNAGEEKKREEGKQFMLWGIIALAVMLSVWGLVNILGTTFNVNTRVLPSVKP
jgi:hypothetical protein